MIKNKLKIFLVSVLFFCASQISAQELSANWKLIKSDEVSEIYVEPEKIVEYGNEISVWAFEKLAKVQKNENKEEIMSIKTHYFFNKMKRKYAEIGVIYYDSKGGIVNRSEKSNFNSGSSAFMIPINSNEKSETVYNSVISYVITGELKMVNSDEADSSENIIKDENLNAKPEKRVSKRAEKNAETPVEKTKIENPIEKIIANKTNDIDFKNDENAKIKVTNDEKNTIENIIKEELNSEIIKTEENQNIIEPSKVEVKEKAVVNPKTSIVNEVEVSKTEYNNQNEKEISTAIFTDGNQFCIQISSWKNKSQAEKEVKSLQNKGYSAFVVSAKPKNRNDIWHRVRVGFFSSLKDAIIIQQQIKN